MQSSTADLISPRVIDGPLAVVGDVHSDSDLLESLLANLRRTPNFADRWVVFAGDFFDRGPDSRGCIDMVLGLARTHGKVAACMGNHDLAAIGATGVVETPPEANWGMRYVAEYDSWATFSSYGVGVTEEDFGDLADALHYVMPYYDPNDDEYFTGGVVPADMAGVRDDALGRTGELLADLRGRMPGSHKAFLAGLPWCIEHPNYLVVHAGLTDAPFEDQLAILRRRDFTLGSPPWLHKRSLAFAEPPGDCSLTVVSGHVVVPEVRFLHGGRRILVDTFGGRGGNVLSAVLLPEMKVVTSHDG